MTILAPAVAGRTRRPVPRTVLVGIGAAWTAAIGAEVIGGAGSFDHDALLGDGHLPAPVALGLFLGAWQVMVAAMMLPSTVPMVRLFAAVSAGQPQAGRALAAFVGGYSAVWTVFGAAAFGGDALVHETVERVPALAARPGLLTASVLALAGWFQFSGLKDRCLRACRHPAAFLLPRYRRGVPDAFRLGREHGRFCVGCCWALMLVAFALGTAHLAWMAGLSAVMAYEKVGRRGNRIVHPVGWAFLAWAALVATQSASLPTFLGGT